MVAGISIFKTMARIVPVSNALGPVEEEWDAFDLLRRIDWLKN